jgi:hypothetical protein
MKIRTNYVSNSSSSSYTVYADNPEDIDYFSKMLEDYLVFVTGNMNSNAIEEYGLDIIDRTSYNEITVTIDSELNWEQYTAVSHFMDLADSVNLRVGGSGRELDIVITRS